MHKTQQNSSSKAWLLPVFEFHHESKEVSTAQKLWIWSHLLKKYLMENQFVDLTNGLFWSTTADLLYSGNPSIFTECLILKVVKWVWTHLKAWFTTLTHFKFKWFFLKVNTWKKKISNNKNKTSFDFLTNYSILSILPSRFTDHLTYRVFTKLVQYLMPSAEL